MAEALQEPLSVVMVSANFHPYIGGTEKQTLELSKELIRRGVRVQVLTRRLASLPKQEIIEGVAVYRLAAPGPGLCSSLAFMASLFVYLAWHARDFSVIHAHLLSSPAVAAALTGRLLAKKVAVKLGGGIGVGEIALSRKSWLGRLKLWAVSRLKPTLVTVSPDQAAEIQASLPGLPLRHIPNGIDIKAYAPATSEQKSGLRKALGWRGLVFLFVGRFAADKRQGEVLDNFLSGWAQAVRNGFSGSFYLVGRGPEEESFRRIIARHGVQSSVHILGPRHEVRELFQAADVFVLPTISEGLSNALLEAMSTGLPILASRVTGTKNVVQEGVHGRLFDPHLSEEAAEAIRLIAQEPKRLQAMGLKARGLVRERFSIQGTAQAWIELYTQLMRL